MTYPYWRNIGVALTLTLTGGLSTAYAYATPIQPGATMQEPCHRADGPYSLTPPSAPMTSVMDTVQSADMAALDGFAGGQVCDAPDTIEIYTTADSPAQHAANAIKDQHPDLHIRTITVNNSLTDLQRERDRYWAEDATPDVNGIGIDQALNGLAISVNPTHRTAVQATSGLPAPRVPYSVTPEPAPTLASAQQDDSPYTMGSALWYHHKGTPGGVNTYSSRCSLGLPIRLNGVQMALTAGHCYSDATGFHDSARLTVGSLYTTAYPGNAGRYGDWQLIKGAPYQLSVYSSTPTNNERLPIHSALTGWPMMGAGMCTSGSTTGQICRYKVTLIDDTHTVSESATGRNVRLGKLIRLFHFGDGTRSDTTGFRQGDSGGPCYASDGRGGVTASGIVSSFFINSKQNGASFFCTSLAGLYAWNKNAAVRG